MNCKKSDVHLRHFVLFCSFCLKWIDINFVEIKARLCGIYFFSTQFHMEHYAKMYMYFWCCFWFLIFDFWLISFVRLFQFFYRRNKWPQKVHRKSTFHKTSQALDRHQDVIPLRNLSPKVMEEKKFKTIKNTPLRWTASIFYTYNQS